MSIALRAPMLAQAAPRLGVLDLAGAIPGLALALIALLQGLAWLGFAAGIPLTPLHLPLAVALLGIGVLLRARAALPAFAAVLALAALSALLASRLIDLSFDGAAYHQPAIIALERGWNPLRGPPVMDWLAAEGNTPGWILAATADAGIWIDRYPKVASVLGACMSLATGQIPAAGWLQGFLLVVAALALGRGLRLSGVPAVPAGAIALVAALCPTALVQVPTRYVDGPLGSALLVLVGAGLAWRQERRAGDLFAVLVAAGLLAGLKFSGAVYAVLLVPVILLLGLRRGAPAAAEWRAAALGVALGVVATLPTYAQNWLRHGHPFHPLNVVVLMEGQAHPEFLALGRFEKLARSLTTLPGNAQDRMPERLGQLPRLWHFAAVARHPDLRFNGFGPLLACGLAASALALAALLATARSRARLRAEGSTLLVLAGALLATVAIIPEAWWARYVPQLWLVPLLVAALAFQVARPLLGALVLAPMLAGSLATLGFLLPHTMAMQHEAAARLAALQAAGEVAVVRGLETDQSVFAMAEQLRQRGIVVRVAEGACAAPARLGFLHYCP